MRKKITHISLSVLRKILEKIPAIGPKLVALLAVVAIPFIAFWKLFRPFVIQFYKWTVLIRQRWSRFFHAQHKILAVVSHKSTIHIFIGALTIGIVAVNVVQAREVRAEEFIDGSVVDTIINPNAETVVTTDFTNKKAPNTYINTSAAMRAQTRIDTSTDLSGANQAVLTQNAGSGKTVGALASTTTIDGDTGSSRGVEKYTVQPGETVGSIAQKFGVSVQTILTTNTMTEDSAKRLKSGDQIYILPTSGVSHIVQSGDTLASIASKYKADADKILEFNKLINDKDLAVGVEIIIPGGTREVPKVEEPAARPSNNRFGSVGRTSSISAAPTNSQAPAGANAAPSGTKLQWPTTTRRISQYFGYRHTGLDIDGEFGDAIYAANGGRVTHAGWANGYGLSVVIDHGGGMQTRYAHLQKLSVSGGQSVSRGQYLGQEGSTGASTGSHLHFEVIINGRFVNPFAYY